MLQNKPNPNYEYDILIQQKRNYKNLDIEIKMKEILDWKQHSEREDLIDEQTRLGKISLMSRYPPKNVK